MFSFLTATLNVSVLTSLNSCIEKDTLLITYSAIISSIYVYVTVFYAAKYGKHVQQ